MPQSITCVVIEQKLPGARTRLISKHSSQKKAEAECDRRNSGRAERPFAVCILLEPVARRMGRAPGTDDFNFRPPDIGSVND